MTTEPTHPETLRALLEAATPGPWRHGPLFWEGWSETEDGGVRTFEGPHVYPNGAHQPGVFVNPDIGRSREPDAALIVAAVNALPDLLDRLERAEGEVARLREAAGLPRNVAIHDEDTARRFKGEWVAVPREDFDALRAALAPETPDPQEATR